MRAALLVRNDVRWGKRRSVQSPRLSSGSCGDFYQGVSYPAFKSRQDRAQIYTYEQVIMGTVSILANPGLHHANQNSTESVVHPVLRLR